MRWEDIKRGDIIHYFASSWLIVSNYFCSSDRIVFEMLDLDTGEVFFDVRSSTLDVARRYEVMSKEGKR